MFYAVVLFTTAFMIAGVAAYFSVYGLAHIFAGSFVAAVIMGSVLELGKIVATSFLYRSWNIINWWLRAYMLVAIMGLMVFTSAGIFGYLSNAYLQDTNELKTVETKVELIDKELNALIAREQQINSDVARVGDNFVSARQNLIRQYQQEQQEIRTRVAALRTEQLQLRTRLVEVESHTGPIIYIAKATGKGVDEAVLWLILLIIVVFDPLAIALTIGANTVWINTIHKRERPVPAMDLLLTLHESGPKRTPSSEVPNAPSTIQSLSDTTLVQEEQQQRPTTVELEDVIKEKMDMISAVLEIDDSNQAKIDEMEAPPSKRLVGALYPTVDDIERVKTYKTPTIKP